MLLINLRTAAGLEYNHFIQQELFRSELYSLPFRVAWMDYEDANRDLLVIRVMHDQLFVGTIGVIEVTLELVVKVWSNTLEEHR